jgi:hypothetical protein
MNKKNHTVTIPIEEYETLTKCYEAIKDTALRGLKVDLNPTKRHYVPANTADREAYSANEEWWRNYLQRADDSARCAAQHALGDEWEVYHRAMGHFKKYGGTKPILGEEEED